VNTNSCCKTIYPSNTGCLRYFIVNILHQSDKKDDDDNDGDDSDDDDDDKGSMGMGEEAAK